MKISKPKAGRPKGTGLGKRLPQIGVRIKGTEHGEDPTLVVHQPIKPDSEHLLPEPTDELVGHKYPPSKKNPTFRRVWGQFIDNVSSRENFSEGHLNSLAILCDLFTEYEELSTYLRTHGRSYQSHGRSGLTWKLYPEVGQLKAVQQQINVYMKQLGLVLKKDQLGGAAGEGDCTWD